MLSKSQLYKKRFFDLLLAFVVFPFIILPLLIIFIICCLDTRSFGVFFQKRIGQEGLPFTIYKFKTLKDEPHFLGHLDKSASVVGKFFRKYKLDELPQIFNVLKGDMGFVGPRPDVPGFADKLKGENRIILQIKPGITGPATLKYKHEEVLLRKQGDPESFNLEVIWPDKVEINKKYVQNWSFSVDLRFLIKSIV